MRRRTHQAFKAVSRTDETPPDCIAYATAVLPYLTSTPQASSSMHWQASVINEKEHNNVVGRAPIPRKRPVNVSYSNHVGTASLLSTNPKAVRWHPTTHAPDDFLRSLLAEARKSLLVVDARKQSEKNKKAKYRLMPPLLANTRGPTDWIYGPPKKSNARKPRKQCKTGKKRKTEKKRRERKVVVEVEA
jgi:hypothetical protein